MAPTVLLYYSNRCAYCREALGYVKQHGLSKLVQAVSIDGVQASQLPIFLNRVPTLIDAAKKVYVDDALFNHLASLRSSDEDAVQGFGVLDGRIGGVGTESYGWLDELPNKPDETGPGQMNRGGVGVDLDMAYRTLGFNSIAESTGSSASQGNRGSSAGYEERLAQIVSSREQVDKQFFPSPAGTGQTKNQM